MAHSEELEEAVVLDSDTTASSLEECRVGWDALDGGLGDFPLHMEPALDPEDTDPGPSGAPPLRAPLGHRPAGEVLGGKEGRGAPSPSSQRHCREECSMRERSPGGGSQELAIRFESPGDEDGPYIHLSCLKRIAATMSQPLASVEVGQVMQSSALPHPRPSSGGVPLRLEPIAAEKGTLALHLLPSAELALIWFPQRPAGQQAMVSDEDALPGSVVAALPCRGAAPAQPGAGRTASVAVEWAGADQTGRTFCIRTDLAPWHAAVPAITFRRFFWLRSPDLGAAQALVEEMRELLGEPPSVAEILRIDPAVVRALAPLVRGQPHVGARLPTPEAGGLANHATWAEPAGAALPPAERALAAALSPAAARQAREAQALRRSLAQTGLSRQYRDGGEGGTAPPRKLPMGLKPGFLAARPGVSRGKPRPAPLAVGSLDFGGDSLESESDLELGLDSDLELELGLDSDLELELGLVASAEPSKRRILTGPPSCVATNSVRESSDRRQRAAADSLAVELPVLAGAPRAEGGTSAPPPPRPVNVSLGNLMDIMGDAAKSARTPRDGCSGGGRPLAAPLRSGDPGCAPGTTQQPRNLRSARCSPTGPPSPEEEGKVDVRNIRELMKPAECKPPAP